MDFDLSLIVTTAIRAIRKAHIDIQKDIAADPTRAFEPARIGRRQKPLLAVDLVAENNTARRLRDGLKPLSITVIGEESLRDEDLDLRNETKLTVLIDMVDGTDLLERRLSNWGSAMVFYYPPERRIVAAFVGLPDEGVYFATEARDQPVRKARFKGDPTLADITGPSSVRCFLVWRCPAQQFYTLTTARGAAYKHSLSPQLGSL
jgi:fructose-1,6-bisphosphatase/inositol monophosphatase family enzyme